MDLELIEGLDGLELDDPGAREPRRDDVLGQLGVRPGGDAPRRVELDAEKAPVTAANFEQYASGVTPAIRAAGPKV